MTAWQAGLAVAVFFVAGTIKGTIGFALPLIGVPFLSIFIGPKDAVMMMSVPVFLTNLAQAWIDRRQWRYAKEIILYTVAGVLAVPAGTMFLHWVDPEVARLMLGLAVYFYLAARGLFPPVETLSRAGRVGIGGGLGALAGFMTGVASVPGPVNVVYFSMFSWPKEAFIFLMNAFNTLVATSLVSSLAYQGSYTPRALLWVAASLVPIFSGMWLGLRLRGRLDHALFYRVVRVALFCVATSLIIRSAWKFLA